MTDNFNTYDPEDVFTFENKSICSVLDFWKFSYGNLAGQSPIIAEFLVAKALGKEKPENVEYWTAYDMEYRNKRIEVKSTEYVHSWNKKRVSDNRTFSVAPTNVGYWNNTNENKLERQNDIYVFCLNTNKELQHPQPLKVDYWEFYVIPTSEINQYAEKNGNPYQKKITLNTVKRLAKGCVPFDELKDEIDDVIDDMEMIPDSKEDLQKLSDLQDEYMELFGEIDYCNVFIDTKDEIETLQKCLAKKVRWKEIVGYDDMEIFNSEGGFYM